MKKIDNVVHNIKTAGLVTGLSLTLTACSNTKKSDLSQQDITAVSHKTDSVLQANPMYSLACNVNEYSGQVLSKYQSANKDLVKVNTIKYIYKNIKEAALRNIMLGMLQQDYDNYDFETDNIYENSGLDEASKTFVRQNYRWFNDAMLYLYGKYTDEQLLKSDFFKVINNERAYNTFKRNAEYIKRFGEILKDSNKEIVNLYDKAWDQSAQEYKKSKQR